MEYGRKIAELREQLPALLNAFLETLSTRDRSVFIRRYYFMETPAEIGERFQIWSSYLHRIRK